MTDAIVNLDKLPLKPDHVGTRFANQYAEIGTALGLKALGANYYCRSARKDVHAFPSPPHLR